MICKVTLLFDSRAKEIEDERRRARQIREITSTFETIHRHSRNEFAQNFELPALNGGVIEDEPRDLWNERRHRRDGRFHANESRNLDILTKREIDHRKQSGARRTDIFRRQRRFLDTVFDGSSGQISNFPVGISAPSQGSNRRGFQPMLALSGKHLVTPVPFFDRHRVVREQSRAIRAKTRSKGRLPITASSQEDDRATAESDARAVQGKLSFDVAEEKPRTSSTDLFHHGSAGIWL